MLIVLTISTKNNLNSQQEMTSSILRNSDLQTWKPPDKIIAKNLKSVLLSDLINLRPKNRILKQKNAKNDLPLGGFEPQTHDKIAKNRKKIAKKWQKIQIDSTNLNKWLAIEKSNLELKKREKKICR